MSEEMIKRITYVQYDHIVDCCRTGNITRYEELLQEYQYLVNMRGLGVCLG